MKKFMLLIFVLCFFSCKNQEQKQISKEVLMLRMEANPAILNPVISTDVYSADVTGWVYDGLISIDTALNVIPWLAKKWEVLDSNKTIKFYIRDDAKFHDGVKLTAHDVKFTYDKIMDSTVSAQNKKADFKDVESVTVPDDTTLIVKYKRSYSPALLSWAFSIMPKHIYGEGNFNNHPKNNTPIGSGPYKFVSWETGQRIKLTRNEDYWGIKPKIPNILYKIITERNSARNAFIKDEIYLYSFEDPKAWDKFSKDEKNAEKYNFYDYYSMGYSYIGWNAENEIFSDFRVRRAMTYTMNRAKILENIYMGKGEVCTGPFYPKSWAYNNSVKALEFNLDSAKQELAKAGWKDSNNDGVLEKNGKDFSFNMLLPSGNKNGELILTVFKEDLAKVGINMNIQIYEWATLLDRVHKRDFDAVIIGWSLTVDPDPYMLFHSSQVDNGLNYYSYKNEKVDSLLLEGQKVFDQEKRTEIYHEVHKIINKEQPYTFLFLRSTLVGVNSQIKNVSVSPLGLMGGYPGIFEWEIQ